MITDTAYWEPDIERLSRQDMVALQQHKLTVLGQRLAASETWRSHFATAGMKPEDIGRPEAFGELPMLEKTDLRALYPYPLLTVERSQVRRFCATSGTTGLPVMFGFTERDLGDLLPRQMARIYVAGGARAGDIVYQGYGYGLWLGGLGFDLGAETIGATCFPVGPGRGELAIQWLRDQGHTVCSVSAFWLMSVVAQAKEAGIDPKRDWRLRLGFFGGQSISAGFRSELEAEMPEGFQAVNSYGTTEAGGPNVGIACPHSHDRNEMHLINEDTVLTEILDPQTLEPVGPGGEGEIVLTTLEKEASPVVRWRTRDLVRLSENPYDCPCGRRGLPLIGPIVGRSDDMLKIRGTMVFPSQVEDVIAATPGTVKEAWQIYIDRSDRVLEEGTVAIERRPESNAGTEQLAKQVADTLRARLGVRLKVECHDLGTLPRYEGKAERVIIRDK
ncbi:MAG: AMP-binding protein [Alphaproteobacteria bacterium]|jgi:phenylacetate-CoA ligase|nr:AMP-binding protein [Alphaproteobacteria bacterium]MDP6624276.1 AMP-binding protein [Alphaproteobacteria bacterium]|tara:strand:- start:756 stop:2090 length:1335 start_codon:yes stop_codon:yes gene_type:complete